MTVNQGTAPVGQPDHGTDGAKSSVDLLESLRRISLAVASNLELDTVLQAIVDAICDHSQWQLCWINEVHLTQNFAEVVARRDKLEYTLESRRRKWDLHRSPSLDAIRLNEPISIPDIALCESFPDYCEDALLRGSVAGVIIPFNTTDPNDPNDPPRVLCVQSTMPLLSDPRQLPFLRTVTGMASLAVNNARQAESKRHAMLQSTESLGLFSFAAEALAQGGNTAELCSLLEGRSGASLILFDSAGTSVYGGHNPAEYGLTDEEWQELVATRISRLADLTKEQAWDTLPTTVVEAEAYLPPSTTTHTIAASRLPGTPSLGSLVSISRTDKGEHLHSALAAAVATIVLRDQVRVDVEQEFNSDMLATLFSPGLSDDSTVIRRAKSFGIDITTPLALAIIRFDDRQGSPSLRRRLAVSAVLRRWPSASAHDFNSDIVAFVPADGLAETEIQSRMSLIYQAVSETADASALHMAWAGPCTERGEFPPAWNDCLTTLELAKKLGRHDPVSLSEFGSYRFLLSALATHDIDEYIQQSLGPIIEHDEHQNSDLLETIETFLHSGCRLQETARRLHIHVSTLRYRLDRVKALTNHDLSGDDTRFEMSLAMRLYRLRGAPLAVSPQ